LEIAIHGLKAVVIVVADDLVSRFDHAHLGPKSL
jgi:hypothetical protein